MKIVATILTVLLSYNLSALACGEKSSDQYSVVTRGSEVQKAVALKEVLVLNSHSGMIEAKSEDGEALVPLRFELASDSQTRVVAVKTSGSTTYVTGWAVYRCINSPTYTNDVYIKVGKYSGQVQIYLLKSQTELIGKDRKADLTLTSEELSALLAKK